MVSEFDTNSLSQQVGKNCLGVLYPDDEEPVASTQGPLDIGPCGEVLRLTPMPRTIPSMEFVRLLKVDARRHEKRSGVWQRVPLRARYWQCTRSTMELRFWRM